MDSQIMVSVVCNAYNHEKYIEKCLQGLVMQKTNFAYEILIHDDASTDGTADIIRTYEKMYPDLIKPIYQTENQYSKGGIYQFQYPRVKGRYIAFCEGDDYWTDENKLQRQYDAVEAHPEVDMCAHTADVISEDGERVVQCISPRKEKCIIPVEDVIYGGGGFVATNSLMYRAELANTEYEFRNSWRIDYTLQVLGALRGGMLYLPENMSAYRRMSIGSWTTRICSSKKKRERLYQKKQQMLECLDRETGGKYTAVIERTRIKEEFLAHCTEGEHRQALSKKYKEIRREKGFVFTAKIYIKFLFPFLRRRK